MNLLDLGSGKNWNLILSYDISENVGEAIASKLCPLVFSLWIVSITFISGYFLYFW